MCESVFAVTLDALLRLVTLILPFLTALRVSFSNKTAESVHTSIGLGGTSTDAAAYGAEGQPGAGGY
jgi:hypothetical protein